MLGGLTVGLAASGIEPGGEHAHELLVPGALAALVLAAIRRPSGLAAVVWLAGVALAAGACGIAIGSARVASIDAGALELPPGRAVEVRGHVVAVPRRSRGVVAVRVATPSGRLLVEAPEPVPDLDVGEAIAARGTIRAPAEWQRDYLERLGVAVVLSARTIEERGQRRGGIAGVLDGVRLRAQQALSAGTAETSSTLLRGFVLGQDDRIDEATAGDFKRSGLAHLLAVSGMNVVLLAILAGAVLALLGVSLRARLGSILVLIAVYVFVTGAGPSIQRAGVMGAAGIVAALAGRPRSRWYVLLLAAAVTLGLDPRAAADIGWQLSFAAVVGILLFAAPLARLISGSTPGPGRRALAEAAALTVAATVATSPLMSLHFGTVSLVSLPANLLAMPAEAPVMWFGMLAAAGGQLDWIPVEPVTWLAGLLAAYIAQVADSFAAPAWAQVDLGLGSAGALAATYALLCGGLVLALRSAARRRALRPSLGRGAALAVCAGVVAIGALAPGAPPRDPGPGTDGLRVSVLDVGQGDSTLLEPSRGAPILVDAGPPEAGVAAELERRGIDALSALVLTHADSDHAGGAAEVLGSVAVEHLVYVRAPAATVGVARAAGTAIDRVAEGSTLHAGDLALRTLWPPRSLIAARTAADAEQPNLLSIVLLARWHGFRILLTGDAEAELAPVHPGDVDVLKVAHHGSQDAGLAALLEEADPELAVISVGAGNPYGHPSPLTVSELERARVPVLRTDLEGEVAIAVGRGGWSVIAG